MSAAAAAAAGKPDHAAHAAQVGPLRREQNAERAILEHAALRNIDFRFASRERKVVICSAAEFTPSVAENGLQLALLLAYHCCSRFSFSLRCSFSLPLLLQLALQLALAYPC